MSTPKPTAPPSTAPSLADAPGATLVDEVLEAPASPARVTLGGFLMGLANLVPGVSGGTMILAVGLYPRFIQTVAEFTSLRWTKRTIGFLVFLFTGLVLAVVGLAGPAVYMVSHHRWAMYSLFVGMTLGGAPELVRKAFPRGGSAGAKGLEVPASAAPAGVELNKGKGQSIGASIALVLGFASMAYIAWSLAGMRVPHAWPVFLGMGAIAAASMILPGISGSYMLLIFGVYDVVIGALSSTALREEPKESLLIIGPVVLGAVLGMAVLSNVLKAVLARHTRVAHGALLGLLLGSILGLWPFQEARYPELLDRDVRKSLEAQVTETAEWRTPFAAVGLALSEPDATEMDLAVERGAVRGELKTLGGLTQRYGPTTLRVLEALGLFVLGFLLVLRLGKRPKPAKG